MNASDPLRIDSEFGHDENIERVVAFSRTEMGRAKAWTVITRHGGPIYGADLATPGLIVERQPDGSIRKGRFLNRRFVVSREIA